MAYTKIIVIHKKLAIHPNTPNHEAFAAIATEIALVRFRNKGRSVGYNREDCELDAQSVSYILCRRFGIDRAKPDMSKLSELYASWPSAGHFEKSIIPIWRLIVTE